MALGLPLFRIDEKNKVVLDKEAIKLCPGLKLLSQQQLLYVILCYDYNQKFHQFSLEERRILAKKETFGDVQLNPEHEQKVLNAINEYMSLQFDEDRATLDAYKTKKRMLLDKVHYEDDSTKLQKLFAAIKFIDNEIKDLQVKIETDIKTAEIKGGGKLSLLETMIGNKEKFKKVGRLVSVNLEEK
jgi:hypothetical protein